MSQPPVSPPEPGPEPLDRPGGPEETVGGAGTGVLPGAPVDPAEVPVTEGEDEVIAQLETTLAADERPLEPYQAIVLASFGGPEAPEEVVPFLRRVTGGRGIPDERLAEVGEHYFLFGGRSPINDQNRALIAALSAELDRRGMPMAVLLGNRNSEPYLADTLRQLHDEGMTRVLAMTTSAYSSYSSCRQYREDLAEAVATLAEEGRSLQIDKVRQYWNHPGFSRVNARLVTESARQMAERTGQAPYVLFVTHSLPEAMDDTSGPGDDGGNLYQRQHLELAAAITAEASATLGTDLRHELVYCSRSGPPQQPWLEPDVNDRLAELAKEGVQHLLLAPIGFISDHMEVIYDLDTQAAETAQGLGLDVLRVPTVGTDQEFVSGLADLVQERAAEARGETVDQAVWPGQDPRPSTCLPGCCPNLRTARPALCGMD